MLLHGRGLFEVQKCCNLRFVVNPLRNAFPFSNSFSYSTDLSSRDGCKGKNFTVSYLIDSFGLTTKLAESISKKVRTEDKGNAESVLSLLRSNGFTDSQISSVITGYPLLLRLDAEKSLGPKLKFLLSRGASSSELTETLSNVPKILGMKYVKSISVYYDFVKEILEADKSCKYEKLCHSLPQGGKQENVLRNVSVLRDLGVPQRLLFSLLISNHNACCGKEKFETSLKKVLEFGFDPTTSRFVEALRIVQESRKETIAEKVTFYKKLGLDVEDVWAMFKKFPVVLTISEKKITQKFETLKKCGLLEDEILLVFKKAPNCLGLSDQKFLNSTETFLSLGFSRDDFALMVKRFPVCLTYSVESIKKKAEFVVKKMNWPLKAVVSNPAVLGYSLEKRTVPRCEVIKALMSKGLIGDELPPLSAVCCCTHQTFLKRFVWKHDDKELVADLMATFTAKKSKTGTASE